VPKYTIKDITQESKAKIAQYEEVTPTLYAAIFNELAKERNVPLDLEEQITSLFIDQKLAALEEVDTKTTNHVTTLDRSAQRAVTAIYEKDDVTLKEVLQETLALRKEIDALKECLFTDTLTQAYNRKWMQSHYLDPQEKFTRPVVLVWIDMNDFKHINDEYGHTTGDKVLQFLVAQLKRSGADVVRYGGDEFMLLFERAKLTEVNHVIENFRTQIKAKQFKFQNQTFKINFSFGAMMVPLNMAINTAIDELDKLMYKDKKATKN